MKVRLARSVGLSSPYCIVTYHRPVQRPQFTVYKVTKTYVRRDAGAIISGYCLVFWRVLCPVLQVTIVFRLFLNAFSSANIIFRLYMPLYLILVNCLSLYTVWTTKSRYGWRKVKERRRSVLARYEIIKGIHSRHAIKSCYHRPPQF
jgi:hypothetical protein